MEVLCPWNTIVRFYYKNFLTCSFWSLLDLTIKLFSIWLFSGHAQTHFFYSHLFNFIWTFILTWLFASNGKITSLEQGKQCLQFSFWTQNISHYFPRSLRGPSLGEMLHTRKAYNTETPWHKPFLFISLPHLLPSPLPKEWLSKHPIGRNICT